MYNIHDISMLYLLRTLLGHKHLFVPDYLNLKLEKEFYKVIYFCDQVGVPAFDGPDDL
jgi:hypothetical protein